MIEITTKQLRQALAESRLHRVLAVLMDWAAKNGEKDVSNALLIQSGQLSEWEKIKAAGTLSRDELLAQRNRLASSLAYFVDQIPNEGPLSIASDLIEKADEKDRNLVLPPPFNPFLWAIIAGIALILGILWLNHQNTGYFSQTIIVKDKKGNAILQNQGRVLMESTFSLDSFKIEDNGEVKFNLDNKFLGDTVKLRISHPQPYQVTNFGTIYTLKRDKPIQLTVELQHLDKIVGRIVDEKTGAPIDSVRVSLQNIAAFTDSNGWFELNIPPDKQAQFRNIRLDKKGYQSEQFSDVPIHTQQELNWAMKPL